MNHCKLPVLCVRMTALALAAALTGCARESGNVPARAVPPAVSVAIARYLEESVVPSYGGDWEHSISLVRIVAVDSADPADILAW